MNTKNASFFPVVAVMLGTGTAPGMVYAAGRPAETEINIKMDTPAKVSRAAVVPFIFFETPALSHSTVSAHLPSPKPAAKDKSALIWSLLEAIFPPPATVKVLSVKPHPLIAGQYIAILGSTGPLNATDAADATSKAQAAVGNSVLIVSNIQPAPAVPVAPVTLTYTLRFLRGTLPDVTATAAATPDITGTGTDTAATDLASFLGTIYPGGKTTVTVHENHLVLVGPPDQVNALRQMLALTLDVPSAQVKADIYTIQVNTTPHNRDATQDKIEEIAAGVQIVRNLIQGSEASLAAYLASPQAKVVVDPASTPDMPTQTLFTKMSLAGYNPSPKRPLSLIDMLILLTVSDRKQLRTELTPRRDAMPDKEADYHLVDQLEATLNHARRQLAAGDVPLTSDAYSAPGVSIYSRHGAQLVKLIDRIESQVQIARHSKTPVPLFSRLANAYRVDPSAKASDIQGMCDFLDAWHDCEGTFENVKGYTIPHRPLQDPNESLNPQDYPDRLSRQSAATDLLLKDAMEALTADLQAVYFQPLLDWIREDVRGPHAGDTGIDIVGTTSLTVRDRTQGETKGTAESFFKFTPIPHLTMDALTKAKDLSNGNPGTQDTTTQTVATDANGIVRMANGDPLMLTPDQQLATDPATGLALRKGNTPAGDPVTRTVPNTSQTKTPAALASTILGALTPLQSLALQAALNEDAIVPTYRKIAPGTSLAIRPFVLPDGGSARVQMSLSSTVDPNQPDADQLAKRDLPFDVITSHTVTTEATISAFDLQTVSSFGVQTTAPGDYSWRIPLLDQIPLLGELFHGPRSAETKRQDSIVIVNLTILPRSLDLVPFYVADPSTKDPKDVNPKAAPAH